MLDRSTEGPKTHTPSIAHCEALEQLRSKIEDELMENGALTKDQNKIDKIFRDLKEFDKKHPEFIYCGDI
ncbi:MAG: hypothetical protein K2X81_05695 [Candidatus Obscuribacterales bacterium]|nr:hypothetical protein [Candidatus Obscuribacterales bacterium]